MRLKRTVLAGGLLAVLAAAATTTVTANASGSTPNIVGGRELSSAPWAAELDLGTGGSCSGTIIAPHWALSAAHCVEDDPTPSVYTVYAGNVKRHAGQLAKVKSLRTHFDLVLLELDRDISTTYAPLASSDPAVNQDVDIYGWGITCESGCGQSDILKTAKLTVNAVNNGSSGDRMVELRQNGDGYALPGDSGGPAMLGGVQFGVLCCGNTGPGGVGHELYSSVPNSLGWITSITGVGGGNPPQPPPPPPGGNLALNKPAKSNQASCNANEGPAKAVNGSVSGGNSDKWCSGAAGTKSIEVDLGANRSIKRFTVKHAGAGGESASYNTRNFVLEVSTGGGVWTTVATVTGNTASTTNSAVNVSARWIRLSTTDPTARIYEFEAYS
jgi:hypothetical protein